MGIISPVATNPDGTQRLTGSLQVLDRNDFLQLLITKLQHQDPLSPMEDSDFVAQLAQFANLEQMNNLADGIRESNQIGFLQTQSLNNVMASGLIGRELAATFSGETGVNISAENMPNIAYSTQQFASEIEFIIRDINGIEVAKLIEEDVSAGNGIIQWDGNDADGERVPDGFYTVEAVARTASGEEFTPSLPLVGIVESVSFRDGAAFFNISGFEIGLGSVLAIGEVGSFLGMKQE